MSFLPSPRSLIVALLAALPFAAEVSAQVTSMPTQVIRRGATGGLALTDGEPISFILEHAQALDLADSQRTRLMAIRRRVRAVNEPFLKRLDSLREMVGISLEPRSRGLTGDDREKLQRFEELSRPIADSLTVHNDAARVQARGVLDSLQVVKLDSILGRARDAASGRRPPATGRG